MGHSDLPRRLMAYLTFNIHIAVFQSSCLQLLLNRKFAHLLRDDTQMQVLSIGQKAKFPRRIIVFSYFGSVQSVIAWSLYVVIIV